MSGGGFSEYNESALVNSIFGYGVDLTYGFGEPKYYKRIESEHGYDVFTTCLQDEYKDYRSLALKINPMDDKLVSELVYDVLCLIHSKDYAESGDTSDDQYEADLRAFKDKWFKGITKPHIKDIIDGGLQDLRKELYKTFNISLDDLQQDKAEAWF